MSKPSNPYSSVFPYLKSPAASPPKTKRVRKTTAASPPKPTLGPERARKSPKHRKQCVANTAAGLQCRRLSTPYGDNNICRYCYQHAHQRKISRVCPSGAAVRSRH
jgi:hypothetical protein